MYGSNCLQRMEKKMKNKRNDLISGIFLAIFGIAIYICTPMLVKTKGLGDVSGAILFPRFLGVALIIVSAALIIESAIALSGLKKQNISETAEKISFQEAIKKEWKVAVLMGLMILYLLAFKTIGFMISSCVITALVLFLLGERKIKNYIICFIVIFLIYLGFTKISMVRLP